ncbi:MAG: glycosyltransferase family 9 protein [Spiribacter sp.]|nr:glycosyltransferase family 9 protein [Spiribacter sp.]
MLRLSAIGDCCNIVPVLRTLQAHYPDTELTWVTGRTEATLFGDLDGIEVIAHDKRLGRRGLERQLKGRSFDALWLMQVALRAGLASRAVQSSWRLGFDRNRSRDGHGFFVNDRIPSAPPGHVIDGFFDFLKPLGLTERVWRWDIPIPAQASARARQLIDTDRPTLLMSPCSSQRLRNYRNWPVANAIALVKHAIEVQGMQVIVTGGGSQKETAYAQALEQACPQPGALINLTGRTDLKTLFALIQRSTVVLAPDSGPVHMAIAAGTPAIGLYATSNPARTGPVLGKRWVVDAYPQAVKAQFGCAVSDVRWGQRVRDPNAMALITPSAVIERLDALLATPAAERLQS